MPDFTHLHVHSHYSLLDGLGKVGPMVEHAKDQGMSALAITDHGAMYGVIEFVQAAKAAGIKPIVGVEAYLAPQGHTKKRGKIDGNPRHLTLLAQNMTGYKNLIKLTTHAHLEGYYYKPRIDYDLLKQHSEGLIVLSGCLNSDISKAIVEKRPDDAKQLIEWHRDVFGPDRFYLEVQDHPNIPEQKVLNDALISLSQKMDVPLVATADSHYIHSDDAEAHDVLVCVQTGKKVSDADRLKMVNEDFSLKSAAEVAKAWREHPEAIDNTMKITEACSVELEFGVNKLPPFPLPEGSTADGALRQLCLEGLRERYPQTPPDDAEARLDYELGVIEKTGFASYFLIVSDFVREAKSRGILVGPGRGSAAGSFVSYLTGITNLDPLAYSLLFERFLNPERVSMPDIDLDFADDRRGEVINYVREKYGSEHVAQIITFGTMAARAAVRDAGRALDFPYAFCDQVAKAIPPMMNFEQALKTQELRELYSSDPQAKRLIDMAQKLEGVCRHASTHAAAVVISDEPLHESIPIQYSSTAEEDTETVTQYDMYAVESLGLLKIDFLGLKNLTIIQNTLNRIEQRHKINIDLDTLPLDNEAAYRLLQEGKTTGVFQLESSGMKRYLKELKPTELEDIISMCALYRPGPMDSIPDFIAAKHGRKRITYPHPILKPILEESYGVIVTQDQVLEIAREFAGFTYAEADILRKAVGKKIKKLLDEQRQKFITGAIESKGIDKVTARKVWDFIEPFARYGFNRAHAACYAMIAYQTAYLKANYPAEFMAALLTSDEGNIERAGVEVAEAISLGLTILPPDVNESEENFTVVETDDGDAIRFGLAGIKNVGHNAITALIDERDENGVYADVADLFARLPSSEINRKSIESLARAGAFDSLGERQQILENADRLLEFNRSLHKKQDAGQQGLFGATTEAPTPHIALEPATAASKEERLRWEKELLGMYVSEHPLQELAAELEQAVTPLHDLRELANRAPVRVAGAINRVKKITTKSDQPMLFVEIEDLTATAEVLVFPSILEETEEHWVEGVSVIVDGTASDKDGDPKVLANTVWPLTKENLEKLPRSRTPRRRAGAPTLGAAHSLSITLTAHASRDDLDKLKKRLAELNTQAGIPVQLVIPQNGSHRTIATPFKVSADNNTMSSLAEITGRSSLQFT